MHLNEDQMREVAVAMSAIVPDAIAVGIIYTEGEPNEEGKVVTNLDIVSVVPQARELFHHLSGPEVGYTGGSIEGITPPPSDDPLVVPPNYE